MLHHPRRIARKPLAFLLAVVALLLAAADAASAQNFLDDLFGGIFGPRHPHPQHQVQPSDHSRMRRLAPYGDYGAPSYWRAQSRAKKAKLKNPDGSAIEPSFFVAVIGDSLAQMLADGLEEAYADRPEIRFLHKAKDNSGLTRDDFYDWPKAVHDLLATKERIDLVIVMIGANDRQTIHQGAETYDPFSPRWRELYAARVSAVRQAFAERKIPLVWVGLPVMKNERVSADMAQLNELYRQAAGSSGAPFCDVWEAFAGERGQYQAFGPDVNGRIVKLRAPDGVHFTEDGARKLAHFVEGEVKRAFEATRQPAGEAELEPAGPPTGQEESASRARGDFTPFEVAPQFQAPRLPERPAVGPVQSLTAPPAAAATELARRQKPPPEPKAAARSLAEHVFVEGRELPPHPGRADDFSWPKNPPPADRP